MSQVQLVGGTLSVTEPSQPAVLDLTGQAMLSGAEFRLEADIAFKGFPPVRTGKRLEVGAIPVEVGGDGASGLTADISGFMLDQIIDAGLGDDNPFVNADITLVTEESDPPCNPADLAEPFGLFDLADVLGFVVLFNAGCP